MMKLFAPAVKLLNRFKYLQKFFLIGLIFLVPLAVVEYILIDELDSRIEFSSKERLGVSYIVPLKDLLQDVQEYGQYLWRYAALKDPSVWEEAELKSAQIKKDIQAVDIQDTRLSEKLRVEDEWPAIKRRLSAFLEIKPQAASEVSGFYGYHSLCKEIIRFIVRVGDNSNLILDPDLDSYYLMDAFVNNLPGISESLDELGILGAKTIAENKANLEFDRISFSEHYGAAENTHKSMENGFMTAFDNNPGLIPAIEPLLKKCTGNFNAFLTLINSSLLGTARTAPELSGFQSSYYQAVNDIFRLYETVAPSLDRLLEARINKFREKKLFVQVLALIMLAIVVYFIIAFYLSVKKTVSTLNEVADRMSLESPGERITLENKDELGEVASAFNKIGNKLKESYASLQVSNEILEEDVARRRSAEEEIKRLNEELERRVVERTAELDRVNNELKNDIERRRQMSLRLYLQYDIARILAASSELAQAGPRLLQVVCETLGWDFGQIWLFDFQLRQLRCFEAWHFRHGGFDEFERVSRRMVFSPGVDLPGRVWLNNSPSWIEDVAIDPNFPRAPEAAKVDLHSALAFPVRIGPEVIGVFEFFSRKPRKPDDELIQMFDTIGNHIGQFVKRIQAEEEIRKLSRTVEQSPSTVVITDVKGNIEYVNHKFVQLTGYDFEEVKGRNINILKSGQVSAGVYKELWGNILSGKEWKGELLNKKKDGELYWEFTYIFPLLGPKGEISHFVALKEDISRRKITEMRLNVQYTVTRILAASFALSEASPKILDIVCESLGWDVGAIWLIDRQDNVLRCVDIRHLKQVEDSEFEEISRKITFAPGVGLPGRVWVNNTSAWIEDVTIDRNFPRAPYAAKAGLHAAFGFPIKIGSEVIGVFEFFSHKLRKPDEELLQMFDSIGDQVGQLVKRASAEEEIRKLNESLELRIVERTKQLEVSNRELKELNGFNRLLLKTIPFGMDIVDEECNILFASQQLEDVLGKDIIGRKCWQLYKDNCQQCADCPVKKNRFELGRTEIIEVSGVMGGRIFQISHTGMVYQGKKAVLEIFEDITERKKAEEEVRLLSNLALAVSEASNIRLAYEVVLRKVCETTGWPYGEIWVPAQGGDYLECYTVWYAAANGFSKFREVSLRHNFSPGIGLPGRAWTSQEVVFIPDLGQDENFPRSQAASDAGLKSGIAIPVMADNQVISVMCFFTPKFEERQSTQIFLAAANQLGSALRRKQVEEELKNAYLSLKNTQSQLIQSAKMASVGQLAGGVAHEINNPLTGVLNNVQLIKMIAGQKQDFSLKDFKQLMDIIEESALRCVKITRSLLDFSHASKDVFQPVNLNEAVEKVIILIGYEMKLQNTVIEKELHPGLPLVLGDSQLLQQTIFDMISNARWAIHKRYQDKDGGRIVIKTLYEPDKKTVCLLISDNGIGIPKENQDKIFEPFFTTKPVGEGTGLGLSIIYNIVTKHNGTIGVESQPNQGAVFKICLPAVEKET